MELVCGDLLVPGGRVFEQILWQILQEAQRLVMSYTQRRWTGEQLHTRMPSTVQALVLYALSAVLTVAVCRYGYNTNTQLPSYKGARHFKTASFS